jgi:hypothetical protein
MNLAQRCIKNAKDVCDEGCGVGPSVQDRQAYASSPVMRSQMSKGRRISREPFADRLLSPLRRLGGGPSPRRSIRASLICRSRLSSPGGRLPNSSPDFVSITEVLSSTKKCLTDSTVSSGGNATNESMRRSGDKRAERLGRGRVRSLRSASGAAHSGRCVR